MFALALFLLSPAPVDARQVSFTILFTNDHHGQLEPLPDGFGGVSRRATLIKRIREEVGPSRVLLVDAGDIFTGGALSGLTKGEADCAAYRLMGYDVVALGNHDFDYGSKYLREVKQKYRIPWISTNVVTRNNNFLQPPFVIKGVGIKLGIVGFANTDTPSVTKRDHVRGMVFNSPTLVAKGLRTTLKKESDIFIVVSHAGLQEDKKLAKAVTYLHVIVGGHSHDALEQPVVEKKANGWPNGPIVVQAGSKGRYLGRLDLTVAGNRKDGYQVTKYRHQLIPVDPTLEPDPEMEALLEKFKGTYAVGLDERICQVKKNAARRYDGDWPLGCLAADAARAATEADVAVLNSGSFRSDLRAGAMTKGTLREILPFEDEVETCLMPGGLLKSILDRSASRVGGGAFLQVSGVVVEGKAGDLTVTVNGEPLAPKREYKVAVNDFLAGGGDGYVAFSKLKSRVKTGLFLRDLLQKSLEDKGEVPESVEDPRWKLK